MNPYTNTARPEWVIITARPGHSYEVTLITSPGMLARLTGKLVYYRQLPDMLTALGYRIILKSLSDETLEGIIRRQNPYLDDIRDGLTEEMTISNT